jgi:hypothetical protein
MIRKTRKGNKYFQQLEDKGLSLKAKYDTKRVCAVLSTSLLSISLSTNL